MIEQSQTLSRRTFIGGAAILSTASLLAPTAAFGVTAAEKQAEADSVRNQLVGLQAEFELAVEKHNAALGEREAALAAMEAEQIKIDEASTQIASLQDHLGTRARGMYRTGSTSFLDFLMGSNSFTEFTQNWDLLNNINEDDAQAIKTTKELRESIEVSKAEYAKQEQIAAEKAAEAKIIKDQTEARVQQTNELMDTLDAEARELLEQEQAAAAAAAAMQRQAEQEAQQQQNPSGGSSSSSTPSRPSGGNGIEVPSQGSVVSYALSRIGCPYILGAAGPDSFDCSGLVAWAYAQVGVSLPHYTGSLYSAARQIVSVSEARPGDVLYRLGHVGIAVGSGGMPYVHAPKPGAYVRDTDSLSWSQFTCALRF